MSMQNQKEIVVRAAPSPSGLGLHIANCRVFLVNYLWAKKTGGKFILRLEDTNEETTTKESKDSIVETMNWLGIKPDIGFGVSEDSESYQQSKRIPIYEEYIQTLLNKNLAYVCTCSEVELEKERASIQKTDEKIFFKYSGECRGRTERPKDGTPYVIRGVFPTEGFVELDDLIFGKIKIPNKENQDHILIRSNGVPLYNFGCVVDDIDMGVTLVIRGRDHMVNFSQQALLYEMLGYKDQMPQFAHMPMINNPQGKKLSKRDADVSVLSYRDRGLPASGILNYILRLGFASKNKEIFSMQEMIDLFNFEGCNKADAKFDETKFLAINYEHLKSKELTPDDKYVDGVSYQFSKRGMNVDKDRIAKSIHLVRARAKTFVEAANQLEIFFTGREIDKELEAKCLSNDAKNYLRDLKGELQSINEWKEQNLRDTTNLWLKSKNMTLKDFGPSMRVALSGRTITPELFQMMEVFGKNETLSRLNF